MKELIVIVLATALLEQAVVRWMVSGSAKAPLAWFLAGCGVFLTATVSSVLTAALGLLAPLGGARLMVLVALIALCALALERQDLCPGLCAKETGGVLLTIGASATLAAAPVLSQTDITSVLRLSLLLGGLYALLSFLLAGILNRMDEDALPASVRGIPVLALSVSLIAIALAGLNGWLF